jgi:hypothetical protein
MIYLNNAEAIAEALQRDLDPNLHRLLLSRLAAVGKELMAWTEFLIIEEGDSEDDIVNAIGATPLTEPFDGIRFGEPGFHPHWDWLIDHGGWFELCQSYGGGFAYVLFIRDAARIPEGLREMCRAFATRA